MRRERDLVTKMRMAHVDIRETYGSILETVCLKRSGVRPHHALWRQRQEGVQTTVRRRQGQPSVVRIGLA